MCAYPYLKFSDPFPETHLFFLFDLMKTKKNYIKLVVGIRMIWQKWLGDILYSRQQEFNLNEHGCQCVWFFCLVCL